MLGKEKLEATKKKHAAVNAKLQAEKARIKAQIRKEDNRLKILIGAAMLADIKTHPETKDFVQRVLQRAITRSRDAKFLQEMGWMKKP